MAENLLITRMTSDDIDDVVLLDRSIFYDPWARTSFSGSLKKDTCLVLRRDGELEGYAIFSSIFDEGELLRIAVNPLSRRKGYATMLMNELNLLRPPRNLPPTIRQRRPHASRRLFQTVMHLRQEAHGPSRLLNLPIAVPAKPAAFDLKPIRKRVYTRSQRQIGKP